MCGTYVKVGHSEGIPLATGQRFLVGSDVIIEVDQVESRGSCGAAAGEEEVTVQFGEDSGPFVVLRISRYANDHEETVHPTSWKFEAQGKYKKFSIGRSQMCDIHLPENTISRTQCRTVFEEGKWALFDGLENKPTVNGTWLCVSRTSNSPREYSEPYPLHSGAQVKISDTVMQIEWDNK